MEKKNKKVSLFNKKEIHKILKVAQHITFYFLISHLKEKEGFFYNFFPKILVFLFIIFNLLQGYMIIYLTQSYLLY